MYDIWNLSRIPLSMNNNPIYKTALDILNNKNISYKDTNLYDFYLNYWPKSLGDIFRVDFLKEESYNKIFLPWIHHKPVNKYKDIAFVDFDIKLKFDKIKNLIKSFEKYGYVPKKFPDRKGGIVGYTLNNKNKNKTYIVSGNHRAAILTAMEIDISFNFEDGSSFKSRDKEGAYNYNPFPTIFSADGISTWPSVKSGYLTQSQALKIIDTYLEN